MTELVPLVVGAYLFVALAAYVLFGGADFGGGILEATLPSHLRRKLEATLAPIWEANHVWLIAVVVILFVGFPRFYAELLTRLYVPMSLALLAILIRGTFFTLRKYDPEPERRSALYTALFRVSSGLAPLFFGFIAAGLLSVHPGAPGQIPTSSFAAVYLWPWLSGFGLLIGAFVMSLFAYVAAVLFFGELDDAADKRIVARRAYGFFLSTFVLGGLVLLEGARSGRVDLVKALSPVFIVCQLVAFALIGVVRFGFLRRRPALLRLAAGAQVLAILGGFGSAQAPALLRTESGPLLVKDVLAPEVTLFWLAIGLTVVLAIVLPLLVVLYRVFRAQREPGNGPSDDVTSGTSSKDYFE